jgi:hypothetical protein
MKKKIATKLNQFFDYLEGLDNETVGGVLAILFMTGLVNLAASVYLFSTNPLVPASVWGWISCFCHVLLGTAKIYGFFGILFFGVWIFLQGLIILRRWCRKNSQQN